MQWEPGCRCCCVSTVCIAQVGKSKQKRELATGCPVSRNRQAGLQHPFCQKFPLMIPILACVVQPYTPRFLFSRFSQPACRSTHQSLSHPFPRDVFVIVIFVVFDCSSSPITKFHSLKYPSSALTSQEAVGQ